MLGKTFDEKLAVIIASWFYSGFIKWSINKKSMAGTWGSLFAIPFCVLAIYVCATQKMSDGSPEYYGLTIKYISTLLYIYFLGRVSIRLAEKVIGPRADYKNRIKSHDQNQIVIDEVLGMLVTYYPVFLGLAKIELWSWPMLIFLTLGFGYFRMFDIAKIWPVKFFDRLESPFGVMMDDVVAGLQAGALLHATAWLLGWLY